MNNLTECEINEVGKMFDDQLNAFEAPDGERISPLGAANDQDDDCISMLQDELGQLPSFQNECERIKSLEQEQEILTQSLLALTTHFAQVQFRLRQIVAAPQDERDNLLTNLEEFAFQGIPEMQNLNPLEKSSETKTAAAHKYRHDELIEQLKAQLDDLEQYAFENGDIVLPQSILVKKQQIIIDELKTKLNLNFDEFDMKHLSSDIIKNHVDTALGEIVNPLKMKEQLVTQLKTQINDLERFICFLQNGSNEIDGNDLKEVKKKGKTKGFDDCKCPVKDGESGKLGRETGAGKIKRNERLEKILQSESSYKNIKQFPGSGTKRKLDELGTRMPLNKSARTATTTQSTSDSVIDLTTDLIPLNREAIPQRQTLEIKSPALKIFINTLSIRFNTNVEEQLLGREAEYYKRFIRVTAEEAYDLHVKTIAQSGSEFWKMERKKRITGSICYNLYTYTKNKNPDWNQKLRSVYNSSINKYNAKHGINNEPKALKIYLKTANENSIPLGLVVHPVAPWLAYSPDGFLAQANVLLEIKCPVPKPGDRDMASFLKRQQFLELKNNVFCLKNRNPYYGQVQLGMLLLNVNVCHLIVYNSLLKSVHVVKVFKDPEFLSSMIPALKKVYFEVLLKYFILYR